MGIKLKEKIALMEMFTKFGNNDNRVVFTNFLVETFVNTRVMVKFDF
jgi:hypothetical protein